MKLFALIGAQVSAVEVVDNVIPSDGILTIVKLLIQLAIAVVPYILNKRKERREQKQLQNQNLNSHE